MAPSARLYILTASLLAGLGGCNLDLGEAPFYCCRDCRPQCPDGYECTDGMCRRPSVCGDGACSSDETCSSCPDDCGVCTASCGNGTCDADESCSSCLEDCGPCPASCGDGTCGPDETCSSCPEDCGRCPSSCGDSICGPGEDPTSCPEDCYSASCTEDATRCDGTDRIEYCEDGVWKSLECAQGCIDNGYDYTVGCMTSPQDGSETCFCDDYVDFGEPCDDDILCDPSLACGVFDGSLTGYCTKTCFSEGTTCSGAPYGTEALCVLEMSSQLVCGFVCDMSSCPTGTTCDYSDYLCKP